MLNFIEILRLRGLARCDSARMLLRFCGNNGNILAVTLLKRDPSTYAFL